jgi:hypothetical protein
MDPGTGAGMTLSLERLPNRMSARGRTLTAYRVLNDGDAIGTVYQVETRWSRTMRSGVRIRDYYPIRWQATIRLDEGFEWSYRADQRGIERDHRYEAVAELLGGYADWWANRELARTAR